MEALKKNNLTVTKANDLIEASYTLNADEHKLLLCSIARINNFDEFPDRIVITAVEYAEEHSIALKSAYQQLKRATDHLYERDVKVNNPKQEGHRKRFRWVESVEYFDREGRVAISFSNNIRPLLSRLTGNFTSYDLKHIRNFKSSYAYRFYELFAQYRTLKHRTLELKWIKTYLELEDKYPRFGDFKAWVLEPALREINQHSDLSVCYTTRRQGRRVVELAFRFSRQKQKDFEFDA